MSGLVFKSVIWGLLSTFISVAIVGATLHYSGLPESMAEVLLSSATIPMLIATPVSYYLGLQIQKIAASKVEITNLHTALVEANDELRERARRDYMTGVLNRAGFFEAAASMPSGAPNSVIMLDIDHFKKINDTYGHEVGDFAICSTVNCVNSVLRKGDIIGRVGGEEFAIALPDTTLLQAAELAEKLRAAIAGIEFTPVSGERHAITVSLGVEEFSNANGLNDALKNADAALYQAKRKGRNCVSVVKKLEIAA